MCSNYPGIKLEPALGHKKTKLDTCQHMLTSSTRQQNMSFYVVERTRINFFKMSKDEKCTCKARKNAVFHCQICKFVGFLLPSSSCRCLSSLLLLCVVIAEKVVKFVLQSLTQPAKQQRDSQACNSKFFIFFLI